MKSLNIEDCLGWVTFDDVRPSVYHKFLAEMNAWLPGYNLKLKQLLAQSEEEIRKHTTISDKNFEHLKTLFASCGLHFGMSEQEFADYIDREYLQKHPEEQEKEVQMAKALAEGKVIIDEKELAKRVEAAIKAENIEDQTLPEWSAQEYQNFVEENVRKGFAFKFMDSDYEWIKFRSLYVAYQHQPWYYRFLYSDDERISLAKAEADKLMEIYTKNFIETVVNNRRTDHEAEYRRVTKQNKANEERRAAIREEQLELYRNELLDKQKKEAEAMEALQIKKPVAEPEPFEDLPF